MKRAKKAYKNLDFLNCRDARALRIMAEYLEPEKRFRERNIKHTVVFFGSARIQENAPSPKSQNHYLAAEELAYHLAKWSQEISRECDGFTICTGGGPGIMAAANRGAKRANAYSIGLNISLEFEQEPNDYISPGLNFEFHYFFMRKLWFLYHAKAAVFFPGGFGTLDELFETLTLVQTGKMIDKPLPILLYHREFWEKTINFQNLVKEGLISPGDIDLFHYFESPEEGMTYLKPRLKNTLLNFCL